MEIAAANLFLPKWSLITSAEGFAGPGTYFTAWSMNRQQSTLQGQQRRDWRAFGRTMRLVLRWFAQVSRTEAYSATKALFGGLVFFPASRLGCDK